MPVMTHAININAPKETVEKYYTDWESYPSYIDNLDRVEMRGPNDMHCKLKLAGMSFTYDAHIEKRGDGQYAWHTTGGDIAHSGQTKIESTGPDQSRLQMTVDYKAPGPEIAGKVAEWLNLAEKRLHHSLEEFRDYTEARVLR